MTVATSQVKERYIAFCRNPLPHRQADEVGREFDTLCSLPEVTAVAFSSKHSFMVGTSKIFLTDPATQREHLIGEFLIHLYRKRDGRVWDVMYGFENVTNVLLGYHHPHISNREIPGIGNLGILCIQQGQFHIYQHMRSGEMHLATKLLIDVLKTYNPGNPHLCVSNWTKAKRQGGGNG